MSTSCSHARCFVQEVATLLEEETPATPSEWYYKVVNEWWFVPQIHNQLDVPSQWRLGPFLLVTSYQESCTLRCDWLVTCCTKSKEKEVRSCFKTYLQVRSVRQRSDRYSRRFLAKNCKSFFLSPSDTGYTKKALGLFYSRIYILYPKGIIFSFL